LETGRKGAPGQSNSHPIRRTLPVNQLRVPRRVPDTGRVSLPPPDRWQTNKILKDRRRPVSAPARRRIAPTVREKQSYSVGVFVHSATAILSDKVTLSAYSESAS